MSIKTARNLLRKTMLMKMRMRKRIRFPKISIRQILQSEDMISLVKELAQMKIQAKIQS